MVVWQRRTSSRNEAFRESNQAGTIRRGTPLDAVKAVKQAGNSVPIHIRVSKADLEAARLVAKRKGLGYQTYLKMLMHEGVQRDAAQLKQ